MQVIFLWKTFFVIIIFHNVNRSIFLFKMTKSEFKDCWETVLAELTDKLGPLKVNTYIRPLIPYKLSDKEDKAILLLPKGGTMLLSMSKKYTADMEEALFKVLEKRYSVELTENTPRETEEPASPYTDDLNLDPRYTFENFVAGANNRLALAASLAVADGYSKHYNPLFIYAGSGLGKTHLMHAIGHYVIQNRPKKKVLYVSAETFINELILSIQSKSQQQFRNKYRKVDYLLFDDVQFIAGKKAAEEELFNTFEALHGANKQLVFTSDRPPKELGDFPERLISRFAWGIPVDIQTPDYETRMAILKNKTELEGYKVENHDNYVAVLDIIAQNIQSNIRELESALTRIVGQSSLTGEPITPALARKVLTDVFGTRKNELTPAFIKKKVASYYGLKTSDLESSKRSRNIAYPRQIAIYLIRELCPNYSLPKIGTFFGGRDHTTVLHSYEKIKSDLKENEDLKNQIDNLKAILDV